MGGAGAYETFAACSSLCLRYFLHRFYKRQENLESDKCIVRVDLAYFPYSPVYWYREA